MSDTSFFSAFGETHRVVRHVRSMSTSNAAVGLLELYRRHACEVGDVIVKGIAAHAKEIEDGSVPGTCLLILAWPEKYKRQATLADERVGPILVLDAIKDGEVNKTMLARIVGHERFDGVDKKIGVRELFFVSQIFSSTRTHNRAGVFITVVAESDVAQTLLQWSDAGYLRFEGKDKDQPSHRVQKMWREFVRQMGNERKLEGLLADVDKAIAGERLYGIALRPNETQILIPSIPALFPKRAA